MIAQANATQGAGDAQPIATAGQRDARGQPRDPRADARARRSPASAAPVLRSVGHVAAPGAAPGSHGERGGDPASPLDVAAGRGGARSARAAQGQSAAARGARSDRAGARAARGRHRSGGHRPRAAPRGREVDSRTTTPRRGWSDSRPRWPPASRIGGMGGEWLATLVERMTVGPHRILGPNSGRPRTSSAHRRGGDVHAVRSDRRVDSRRGCDGSRGHATRHCSAARLRGTRAAHHRRRARDPSGSAARPGRRRRW